MSSLERGVVRATSSLVLGAVVGVAGTVVHRGRSGDLPWGIVLALALVTAASVLVRAWAGRVALLAVGLGVAVAVQLLAQEGPGGDVLVTDGTLGWVWVVGSLLAVVAAALAPARWFADPAPEDAVPENAVPEDVVPEDTAPEDGGDPVAEVRPGAERIPEQG